MRGAPEVRHRHAGLRHEAKGLAGIRSCPLPFDRIGNENDTGEAEPRGCPGEPCHLDSGDPASPVDHHDTAGEVSVSWMARLRKVPAVGLNESDRPPESTCSTILSFTPVMVEIVPREHPWTSRLKTRTSPS